MMLTFIKLLLDLTFLFHLISDPMGSPYGFVLALCRGR